MFIAIDGQEGSGKTTQATKLHSRLGGIMVRDPGTTNIGEQIRTLLLSPTSKGMHVRTEMMLFMAARAEMMDKLIQPALQANKPVITDRFVASTVAYQHGIPIDTVLQVAEYALGGLNPDLTIILDLPVEVAMSRLIPKFLDDSTKGELIKDRFEQKSMNYHEMVRNRYRNLCSAHPEKFVLLDVTDKTIDIVHFEIMNIIHERL